MSTSTPTGDSGRPRPPFRGGLLLDGATTPPRVHLRWLAVFLAGVAMFVAVLAVLLDSGNPVYVPSLLLLGAAVVPVTFTTFVVERNLVRRISIGQVLAGAVLGGVIGAVVAGQLEFETARELGSLPTVLIGLIEESAKLAVPAVMLAWRRPRAMDGLVLGVAVGSGFAALETMGYAFVTLLHSGGQLGPVTVLLFLRAVASPGGHGAWTGLACAALFAIRGARRRGLAWLRFLLVFAGVVAMHATWDSTANGYGHLVVGAVSFVVLILVTWRLHRTERARLLHHPGVVVTDVPYRLVPRGRQPARSHAGRRSAGT